MSLDIRTSIKYQELLKSKGVLPYDYMDVFERFIEKCLPRKECFDSA